MGNPYTPVTVSSYNATPPSDDGSRSPENEITWAKHKTKLADPVKNAIEAVNTNILSAFGKVSGGITITAVDYTILAGDQGKVIVVTGDNKTVTMIAPASVGSPFRVHILNLSAANMTVARSAAETIDGVSSLTVRAGGGITLDTNGTNWYSAGQNYAQTNDSSAFTIRRPEGYLTMVTGTPIIAADVIAGTAVYYTPDIGGLTPISDGSAIAMNSFSERTLTLNSNHIANAIYDVFIFKNSGVVIIGTGPAWNTATAGAGARGTGAGTTELERWNGFLVNKVSMTVRNGATTYTVAARAGIYLGSILMDGTNGQLTCHRAWGVSRKWGVWNFYNRKRVFLKSGEGTQAGWTYASAVVRQSKGTTNSKLTIICGVAEELVRAEVMQTVFTSTSNDDVSIGIGWNVTNAFSGMTGRYNAAGDGSEIVELYGRHINAPFIGRADIASCEIATVGTIDGIFGGEQDHMLTAEWMG